MDEHKKQHYRKQRTFQNYKQELYLTNKDSHSSKE